MSLTIPTDSKVGSLFQFRGGINTPISKSWQAGAALSCQIGRRASSYALSVGPTYNFNFGDLKADIKRAFYVSAMGGVVWSEQSSSDEAELMYSFAIGKRFPIFGDVLWKPEIGLIGISNNRPDFTIIPIQFAAFF